MTPPLVIAVDGPAASGKGTIARALARHYGLPHLDTGLLYRAVGLAVVDAGADPADAGAAHAVCAFDDMLLADPRLRAEAAGNAASIVSAHPQVRAALIERQRAFAAQPCGAVLDGRDIGTVIAPDAAVKLYVTATPAVRAARRFRELAPRSPGATLDAVLADIRARDARDSGRSDAPLRQADDALLLDTSALDVAGAIAAAVALVECRRSGAIAS